METRILIMKYAACLLATSVWVLTISGLYPLKTELKANTLSGCQIPSHLQAKPGILSMTRCQRNSQIEELLAGITLILGLAFSFPIWICIYMVTFSICHGNALTFTIPFEKKTGGFYGKEKMPSKTM